MDGDEDRDRDGEPDVDGDADGNKYGDAWERVVRNLLRRVEFCVACIGEDGWGSEFLLVCGESGCVGGG